MFSMHILSGEVGMILEASDSSSPAKHNIVSIVLPSGSGTQSGSLVPDI